MKSTLQLVPGVRYDMPASFGPTILPAATAVPNATMISTAFDSTPEAVAAILAPHLMVGDVPTVYVNRISYDSLDYLYGRGYEEVIVAMNARYRDDSEEIAAPYVCAVWVNQVAPLIPGRELMGHPKVYADIPEVVEDGTGLRFEASEYETCFLRGEVRALKELPAATVARIRGSQTPYSFGWKYVPGPDGTVDVDYGTLARTDWNYERCWVGEGESWFLVAPPEQLPVSSRVVSTIASMPVVKRRPAFVGKGQAIIDRAATRRLGATARAQLRQSG